jgi:hypothetical protein
LSCFTGQVIFVSTDLLKYGLEAGSAKQPEDHFNAEIGLKGLDASTAEKTCEVGGGGIGGIQLSERRDEE